MSLENKIVTMASAIGADVRELKSDKVDKVSGKGLSDTNFTQAEKTKLAGVAVAATKNRADTLNADKVHTHTTTQVVGLDTALENKVDKVAGKGLSASDYTAAEKTKLSGIATGATKNRADSANADKVHTHTTAQITGLDTALASKVDKVTGKGLSDTNFTQAEKDKLSSLESSKFVGLFVSESALPLSGSEGDYANVDGGVGSDVYRVIWDSSDSKWVRIKGVSTELTPAQIKQQYEGNPDTNAYTDAEKTKLSGVATGATKNRADTLNADKIHKHVIADVTGLDAALLTKFDKADITQVTGSDPDKVMSQKAVTDNLDSLGVELELLRQELDNLKDMLPHDIFPAAIGDERWGGFYIGDITIPSGDDAGTYMVIMAGEEGGVRAYWKIEGSLTTGITDDNNGKLNTLEMVNAGIGEHPAGEYCVNYRGGGFDDWYMPAINEVVLAWDNRALLGDLKIESSIFWSSTQHSVLRAWAFNFNTGKKLQPTKDTNYQVRPVRRIKKS